MTFDLDPLLLISLSLVRGLGPPRRKPLSRKRKGEAVNSPLCSLGPDRHRQSVGVDLTPLIVQDRVVNNGVEYPGAPTPQALSNYMAQAQASVLQASLLCDLGSPAPVEQPGSPSYSPALHSVALLAKPPGCALSGDPAAAWEYPER